MHGLCIEDLIQEIKQGKSAQELQEQMTEEELQQLDVKAIVGKEKFGRTLLHFAAKYNNKSAAEWFLSLGADINAKDKYSNDTPVHMACKEGHTDMVLFLLDQGASATEKDENEWDLLLTAAEGGLVEVGKRLLSSGHDPLSCDWRGHTALHMACTWNRTDFVRMILDGKYIDVNIEDNNGVPPICMACGMYCCESYELVSCLIDHGADLTACDAFGVTPLGRAKQNNRDDLVTLMESKLGTDAPDKVEAVSVVAEMRMLSLLRDQKILSEDQYAASLLNVLKQHCDVESLVESMRATKNSPITVEYTEPCTEE